MSAIEKLLQIAKNEVGYLEKANILDVENPTHFITFEDRVFLGHMSFIDAYIDKFLETWYHLKNKFAMQ